MVEMGKNDNLTTGQAVRLACRKETLTTHTATLAPTYVQANLIVLPSKYAPDFRLLCQRNPVPCPLLAESKDIGVANRLTSHLPGVPDQAIAQDVDLRHDIPRYMVYQDGKLTHANIPNVAKFWTADHVGFLIGCSFSFDTALTQHGLIPPHVKHGRNVPMYRTTVPLSSAGVFRNATMVVSMRVYDKKDIERVRDVTRPFISTHGEPVAWGWDAASQMGISDISHPQWGDPPVADGGVLFQQQNSRQDGEQQQQQREDNNLVPVFWGCGVTPQDAVMQAGLSGTVLSHTPGHMLLLDLKDLDIVPKRI